MTDAKLHSLIAVRFVMLQPVTYGREPVMLGQTRIAVAPEMLGRLRTKETLCGCCCTGDGLGRVLLLCDFLCVPSGLPGAPRGMLQLFFGFGFRT